MPEADDLATLAAVVARQGMDLNVYASFLTTTLSGALPPDYLTVERHRTVGDRLGGKPGHIRTVSVQIGDNRFSLHRASHTSAPQASITHVVRGIALRTDHLPLHEWAQHLVAALAELASSHAAAAEALARITSFTV